MPAAGVGFGGALAQTLRGVGGGGGGAGALATPDVVFALPELDIEGRGGGGGGGAVLGGEGNMGGVPASASPACTHPNSKQ